MTDVAGRRGIPRREWIWGFLTTPSSRPPQAYRLRYPRRFAPRRRLMVSVIPQTPGRMRPPDRAMARRELANSVASTAWALTGGPARASILSSITMVGAAPIGSGWRERTSEDPDHGRASVGRFRHNMPFDPTSALPRRRLGRPLAGQRQRSQAGYGVAAPVCDSSLERIGA